MNFRRWKSVALAASLLLLFCGSAMAADEAEPKPWGGITSTFGPAGTIIPAGVFVVGGNVVHGESDGTRRHSKYWNGATDTSKWTEVVKFRYGILPNLDLRTSTPIYSIHTNTGPRNVGRTNYGVGDTAALFHSLIMDQKKGDLFSIGVDYGGILPSASVSDHSVNSIGNEAWGLMGGVGATYFHGSHRIDVEVNYATFTEGSREFQKGDRMRWNTGYAYALNNMWDIGVETTYEWNAETKLKEVGQKDSSEELYGGPKIAFKYAPWATNMGLLASTPLYRWYQGTKTGSDDYRVDFKIMKSFDIGKLFD